MNTKFIEAREYIAKAHEALRRGDKASARQLVEQAALLAPKMEDVWLILAASDPNPRDALAYARKALEINPQSVRARRGVEWTLAHLKQAQTSKDPNPISAKRTLNQAEAVVSLPKKHAYQTAVAMPQLTSNGRNWLLPALLTGVVCTFFGFIALFTLIAEHPALASIANSISAPTQENLWASVDIAKPAITPIDVSVFAPQLADAPGSAPSNDTASMPTDIPTLAATEGITVTPEATETPGTMAMEIVDDNLMSQSVPPEEAQMQYPAEGNGERWIDVNLSEQRVSAYESDTVVNSFLVSTGVPQTPTVTGKYKIYVKVRVQDMSGPGYYLRDVPYVMFFYKGYGFHGTYWHNNFGTPMSRGCVNLTIPDAEWLYNWASVGTVVNVHY